MHFSQEDFPVLELLPELNRQFLDQRILILQAPPGAGKSTVLPLELLKSTWLGKNKILLLEPRRLAAISVARRMASLSGEEVGQTIGYRIRFDQKNHETNSTGGDD